jgi:hypothetical protein
MAINKIPGSNIFTQIISDHLGVSLDVALRVQNYIDNFLYCDWSEAELEEIHMFADEAFDNLNVIVKI